MEPPAKCVNTTSLYNSSFGSLKPKSLCINLINPVSAKEDPTGNLIVIPYLSISAAVAADAGRVERLK